MFAAVITPILTVLAAAAIYVRADPNPNSPGPGDVFIEGKPCTVSWDVDPTGLWKTMKIELMTGDNFDMSFLTAVGTVDGTNPSKNTFSYTCPQVSPHSPIYFYQFSSPAAANKTWTGRFAITDSAKNVVAPSHPTQPDGEKIPWGTGSLVNASASAPGSPVASARAGGALVDPSASSAAASPSVATGSPSSAASASNTSTPSAGYLTSYASATPSTVSSTRANGAMAMLSALNILFQTGLALGLAAFGFTMMF